MAKPAKWDWNISNINASAEATQKAYKALTTASNVGYGPTRDFSVVVWNDIVDKIIEQRQYLGDTDWSRLGITKGQSYMIPGYRMTADRFNAAVLSMPPVHSWGWEATLGRKTIKKGDVCYGAYFIYLVDGLNHWIDLTHLPFDVDIPIHARMNTNALVRRALHIINSQNIKWRYNANAVTLRVLRTKARFNFNADIHLNLPLYNTQHIMLPLFYNLRTKNKTAITTASHIIAENNVQLNMRAHIMFGDVVFILCNITGLSDLKGKLSIPPSIRVRIENLAELINTGNVTVSRPKSLTASILGQFTSEAWVREPDSIAVKENLQIEHSSSLTLTFSDILHILADLNVELSHNARLSTPDTGNVLAALDVLLEHRATTRNNGATQLRAELIGKYDTLAMIYRRRFTTHSGDLAMELLTSATARFAAREIYTATDLLIQSDMSATATFARREMPTGAALLFQSLLSARAELQSNKIPMGVNLCDTFNFSTKAAINPNIMATGVRLTDSIIGPTASIIINPGNVLPYGAELSDSIRLSATISTFNNQLYAGGNITGTHTGKGILQLAGTARVSSNANSEFSGSARLDMDNTELIRADINSNHTCNATIITQRLVLASEIDDVLVSELDEMLVNDLEFRY